MSSANIDIASGVWHRHSFSQRAARFMIWFVIVAAIVAAGRSVEVIPEFLADAPEQIADLLKRMWPPAIAYYPKGIHAALIETLHIASLGTILAVFMALPFGLLAARNL